MTPTIETERLSLRAVQMADAANIYEYVRNPNVLRYTTGTPPKAFAETVIYLLALVTAPENQYAWSLRLAEQAEVIGLLAFEIHDETVATVDYALAEPHWGKGLMTEAVGAVIDWAFQSQPMLASITSAAMTANPASTRVQEKCGMKVDRIESQKWTKFDEPVELAFCSISKIEWENQKV